MYLKNRSLIVVLQMNTFRVFGEVVTWPGWQVVMDRKNGKYVGT